jgi:hypothetical protein
VAEPRNGTGIESDGDAHVRRTVVCVLATECELRPRQEHASPRQPSAHAVHHEVEGARLNERDGPMVSDFLLGVVVDLMRRMVEATDRQIGGRVEQLVPVQGRNPLARGRA